MLIIYDLIIIWI